jgi:hypothetical protein
MRRKHDTVNGNCLCDTPDPSSSRRLFSPSRDYRPPPSRDSWQSRVLSTLHANPRRWLLNGYPPTRLPGAYNDNDPDIYDPSVHSPARYSTKNVRLLPCCMFTKSNPESLQGRAIRTPVLLLQKTLHETVHLISCNVAPLVLVISDAGVSAEGGPTVAGVVIFPSRCAQSSHLSCHPCLSLRKSGSFILSTLLCFLIWPTDER